MTKQQQYNEYLAWGGTMTIEEWVMDGRYDPGADKHNKKLMNKPIEQIADDGKTITFLGEYEGKPIHFYMNKATKEIYINAEDMAQCLGYKDQEDMLGSDAGLDALLDYQKENPDKPFLLTKDDL